MNRLADHPAIEPRPRPVPLSLTLTAGSLGALCATALMPSGPDPLLRALAGGQWAAFGVAVALGLVTRRAPRGQLQGALLVALGLALMFGAAAAALAALAGSTAPFAHVADAALAFALPLVAFASGFARLADASAPCIAHRR